MRYYFVRYIPDDVATVHLKYVLGIQIDLSNNEVDMEDTVKTIEAILEEAGAKKYPREHYRILNINRL